MDFLATPGTIVLAILALGVLIIVHEGGHFLIARLSGMRVDRFSIGFGPKLFSFKRGETVYQIAAIPLGGFVQIAGLNPGEEGMAADDPRAYPNRPVWQRLATIFAGPATNYVFAALLLLGMFLVWGVPTGAPIIGNVVDKSPAAAAGFHKGDEILKVGGALTREVEEVRPLIDASGGKPLDVDILREGKPLTIHVTPEKDGDNANKFRIGVVLDSKEVWAQVSTGARVKRAMVWPFAYSSYVLRMMFTGGVKQIWQEGSGPPGIIKEIKKRIEQGPRPAFLLIAMLSIYLGLFNLLPLPGLDGGRLVFLGWEAISRRRVNQRVEAAVHMVGVLMLLALILVISIKNDFHIGSWFKH
jgi:regulator of sigma E protease